MTAASPNIVAPLQGLVLLPGDRNLGLRLGDGGHTLAARVQMDACARIRGHGFEIVLRPTKRAPLAEGAPIARIR
jgi:hypothetical protein